MSGETPKFENINSKESIKGFLANEFNKPELIKKTAESIDNSPQDLQAIKNMLEKSVSSIVSKGERLDISRPDDIKKSKILIAFQMLEYGNIDSYFPIKPEEQINRASRILENKINESNFDKKQGQSIVIENCSDSEQKNQVISYKEEFTSGNQKFDQLLQQNIPLKKYLDLQVSIKRLNRLSHMVRYDFENKGNKDELRKEIDAKYNALSVLDSELHKELYDNPNVGANLIKQLNSFSPDELNSLNIYEIKKVIRNFLNTAQDKTFSYRDFDYDDGVNYDYEKNQISIKPSSVQVDNMKFIGVGQEGIKLQNIVTKQETVLSQKTLEKGIEINAQEKLDRKYIKDKRAVIIKKFGFDAENLSVEERQIIEGEGIKDMFLNDSRLFDLTRKDVFENGDEGMNLGNEDGLAINKIFSSQGVTNFDCSKGKTKLSAKEINGKKVLIFNQGDATATIGFNTKPIVEFYESTQEEINEPVKEIEKSSAYLRAENEISNPREKGIINLSGLGLNSKEVSNLLSNHKLLEIENLKINLNDNNITTIPVSIFSMNNLKEVNLGNNLITKFPEKDIDKQYCEKLETIMLDGNNLSKISDSLIGLTQLKKISLSNNLITAIPSSIDQLSDLELFNIDGNEIKKLPEEITKIETLKLLSADHCNLDSLPIDINQLINLETLSVSNNNIKILPDVSTLIKLQHLNISKNELSALPPLGNLKELKSLGIEDNKNLSVIPSEIKELPNLESDVKLMSNIKTGENIQNQYIDGSKSKEGYEFPDGANDFFVDDQQYKFTISEGKSEDDAQKKASQDLKINNEEKTFSMKKKLKNGGYSIILFAKASQDEYYAGKV